MRAALGALLLALLVSFYVHAEEKPRNNSPNYRIVDTGVTAFYDNTSIISMPKKGEAFFGQDAQYQINLPSYADNGDGTITDNVSGLIWQKVMGEKTSFKKTFQRAKELELGGHHDWRVPSIKELYSLIQFTGRVKGQRAIEPFIDTRYFKQPLGDSNKGERQIDAQTWSSTEYVGRTMRNDETVFGVNFIDGRIKGYPKYNPRTRKPNKMYFRFVRGNIAYGKNSFIDNGNGTITDSATRLMWQQSDSGKGVNWEEALKYAESLELGGYDDWRLPNSKELQSIVDYTRSVQTTGSAVINPVFKTTVIRDPERRKQYPYFWTGTTHLDGRNPYESAVYIAFGEAQGKMRGRLMDVHGAGAQRSDPKIGSKENYPQYFGPQGDVRYVFNYARCVRGGSTKIRTRAPSEDKKEYPDNVKRSESTSLKEHRGSTGRSKTSSRGRGFVERLDRDGDGQVSRSEFDGPKDRFGFHDKNNNGYLSEDEAPKGPPPRGGRPPRP